MGLWFYDFKTKQNCVYKDKSDYQKKLLIVNRYHFIYDKLY